MMKFHVAAVAILLVILTGCPKSSTRTPAETEKMPLAGVTVTIAIVDDPDIAAAITRLQGEWNAQTGAELTIIKMDQYDLSRSQTLSADALICGPRFIGLLAEQELIVPLPNALQKTPSWSDIFDLSRYAEVAWGGKIMAVPFGSPVFVVYYRADLLEKLHRKPPRTWAEYQELAEIFAEMHKTSPDTPEYGTAEPWGPGWAGLVLLARAAPYLKHRDNYSTLFNIETMEPLVAGPPMLRALEELVAAAKFDLPKALQSDPDATRAAFWRGKCAMAISWPSAAGENPVEKTAPQVRLQISVCFMELPGSNRVFNINSQAWETRGENEDPHVPFLCLSGRVGMVSRESTQQEAAFQLLFWLANEQNSNQISPASPATTLFRQSHLKQPSLWVEKDVSPATALQYAELTAQTLRCEQWMALRIPGREEYLAALDEAVQTAVRGELSPADALTQAAKKWQEITEKLGVELQRKAYLHSLGLE